MPSNDDAKNPDDRLDPFLIAAPTGGAADLAAGLDAFLASPPIPRAPEPTPAEAPRPATATTAGPLLNDEEPSNAVRFMIDQTIESASLPILDRFPPEAAVPPAVGADGFGEAAPPLIAATVLDFRRPDSSGAEQRSTSSRSFEADQGRGGDAPPSPFAFSLDDRMLADPPTPLSAVSWSSAAASSSLAPPAGRPFDGTTAEYAPSTSRFGSFKLAADGPLTTAGDSRMWEDARPSAGSDVLDRLEGRLSTVVARLEAAASTASATGAPPSISSRPRGFKGRVDF